MAKRGKCVIKTPMGRVKYSRSSTGVRFSFEGEVFSLPAHKLMEFASIDEAIYNVLLEEEDYDY